MRKFLGTFFVFLGVLVVIDFFIPKHPHFPWEDDPNFFAVYGFTSCVALIFLAKVIRRIVGRDERYYDK